MSSSEEHEVGLAEKQTPGDDIQSTAVSSEEQKESGTETQPPEDDIPGTDTDYSVQFAPVLGYAPAPSPGPSRKITAKVNSLDNVTYEPGGGHVAIVHRKVDFSNAKSKYDSKANLHYKPGGGNFVIIDEKLKFKEASKPKVNSLQNVTYTPHDGDKEIFNEKLPWLKFNKPKLPREEFEKINKHAF